MNNPDRLNSFSGPGLIKRYEQQDRTAPWQCATRRKPRVAFYSHDTMGMGHLRRNMLIASSLSSGRCQADTLLIAGTREAGFFAEQAGLDCVTLPALAKTGDGQYSARRYSWSLEEATRLRGRVIASTLLAFQPDILVVDKLPQGICNELQRSLKLIRSRFQTHCVLGLRDVLDDPKVAIREWVASNSDEIVAKYFDEIWVYGDPKVYDCRQEYCFPKSTTDRICFTGYLDQRARLGFTRTDTPPAQPLALCMVGGGQDGAELAKSFVEGGVPKGWRGAVIAGPFMPAADKQQLVRAAAQLDSVNSGKITIIDQLVEADAYVNQATRIVAMGGYNTVMSVLSFRKPALIVPRTHPRAEQWIRADRLASSQLVTTIHHSELRAETIRNWLSQPQVANPVGHTIDLGGLDRIQTKVLDFTKQLRCQA
jgi:predicted glycosyltransferase